MAHSCGLTRKYSLLYCASTLECPPRNRRRSKWLILVLIKFILYFFHKTLTKYYIKLIRLINTLVYQIQIEITFRQQYWRFLYTFTFVCDYVALYPFKRDSHFNIDFRRSKNVTHSVDIMLLNLHRIVIISLSKITTIPNCWWVWGWNNKAFF